MSGNKYNPTTSVYITPVGINIKINFSSINTLLLCKKAPYIPLTAVNSITQLGLSAL